MKAPTAVGSGDLAHFKVFYVWQSNDLGQERQSTFFVLFLLWGGLCLRVTPWLNVSITISSETIVTNGVVSPIPMVSFPPMETLQTEWITNQPDIAGSQIEILVTYHADIFDPIPDVAVGNHYHWLHHYRRRYRNDRCLEYHPPIWLNQTA